MAKKSLKDKPLPSRAERKAHAKEKNEQRIQRRMAKKRKRDAEANAEEEVGFANEDTGFISLSGAPAAEDAVVQVTAESGASVTHISGSNAPQGKGKKRKLDKITGGDNDETNGNDESTAQDQDGSQEAKAKPAKPKRKAKNSKEGEAAKQPKPKQEKSAPTEKQITTESGDNEAVAGPEDTAEKSQHRFICFVGQLPRSASVEDVKKHFSKIAPTSVRLSTDKQTGKGKGFGFIEFSDYDRMKTCLKLYHHSEFDDGTNKPRKINVELT